MPRLFLEDDLGKQDKKLRDKLYDGLLGRYYSFAMPLLAVAARPFTASVPQWGLLFLLWFFLISGLAGLASSSAAFFALGLFVCTGLAWLFIAQQYLFYLMLLALPVKLILLIKAFKPGKTFFDVHEMILEKYRGCENLDILDVSTGSCNSLFQHGWMDLSASYTGIDLSETMLSQGQEKMSDAGVAMEFIVGDAMRLPLSDGQFDLVLNYGAMNAYEDSAKALQEILRVLKPGGEVLFLDEELYSDAGWLEKLYFEKVLASHDVLSACPRDLIPDGFSDVCVYQVYEFYYICTARKEVA